MKQTEKLPIASNIPSLHGNIEGLRRHSFTCAFLPEPLLTQNDLRLRSWLLHTVVSASRHYSKARELVERQNNADQTKDGGAIFHILDVSEQIEDCVMATFRVCMAIRRFASCQAAQEFAANHKSCIEALRSIRNQFDHMHSQIIASEAGQGPISIVFGDEGKCICFRKLRMKTSSLHTLLDGAYRVVAGLYPAFNVNSAKEAGGPTKLTITASIIVTDAEGAKREIG